MITEKDYPIQTRWIWKSLFSYLLSLIFILIIFAAGDVTRAVVYLIFIFISAIFVFIQNILRRRAFHYEIGEQFLNFEQGILSKKQRHIPYGVIQNLFVKQDLFDRLFSIASLTIENASQGGQNSERKVFGMRVTNQQKKQVESVGFDGNKVVIPGLNKQDAETLKQLILQKMKENPLEDNQSGL